MSVGSGYKWSDVFTEYTNVSQGLVCSGKATCYVGCSCKSGWTAGTADASGTGLTQSGTISAQSTGGKFSTSAFNKMSAASTTSLGTSVSTTASKGDSCSVSIKDPRYGKTTCTKTGTYKCPSGYTYSYNSCKKNQDFKKAVCSVDSTQEGDIYQCYSAGTSKTCADGGYFAACPSGQTGTAVSYCSNTCYKDCKTTCPDGHFYSETKPTDITGIWFLRKGVIGSDEENCWKATCALGYTTTGTGTPDATYGDLNCYKEELEKEDWPTAIKVAIHKLPSTSNSDETTQCFEGNFSLVTSKAMSSAVYKIRKVKGLTGTYFAPDTWGYAVSFYVNNVINAPIHIGWRYVSSGTWSKNTCFTWRKETGTNVIGGSGSSVTGIRSVELTAEQGASIYASASAKESGTSVDLEVELYNTETGKSTFKTLKVQADLGDNTSLGNGGMLPMPMD